MLGGYNKMVNNLQEPERIARLPHYKGLPITAITMVDDEGVPNFRMVDSEKAWELKKNKCCSICGEPLDYWMAFMVSEGEAESRLVYESPNHEECLRHAFAICPWLFYSKHKYSDPSKMHMEGVKIVTSHPDRAVINERPDNLGIYICRSYENVVVKGMRVCKVSKAVRIEWIKGH
jgi:hypothetical protein